MNLAPGVFAAVLAALAALAILCAIQFAIGWHRYALRPEVDGEQRLRHSLTYIRATLVIAALVLIPVVGVLAAALVLGMDVSWPAAVLGGFMVAAVIGKFALAWPAAATGRRHVLRHGWVMSSGLVPQLVLILLLVVGPFDAAAFGLLYVADKLPGGALAPLAVAVALLGVLGAAAGATALSFAYRWRLRQDNSHWWRHAG